jgi:hypothetical protein
VETRNRHTQLTANFVNGYAEGWFMTVKDCYRNELDIKLTERKKNKKPFWEWTQGPYLRFAEGHLFYDTPKAYEKWEQALKAVRIACQITSAKPTILDKNRNLVEGTVTFTIYKPDKEFTSLIAGKEYKLSQREFVNFLKTGELE